MKITLLLLALLYLAAGRCLAQDNGTNRYALSRSCTDKIKVYQSFQHKPYLEHYRYMSRRFWVISSHRPDPNNPDYVRIYIPDNEPVAETKLLWNEDGQTVDKTDYNTWLYVKKSDLAKFRPIKFSDDYTFGSLYQQMIAQNPRH